MFDESSASSTRTAALAHTSTGTLDLVTCITERRRALRALPPGSDEARALREELRPLYGALSSRRRTTQKPRPRSPLEFARELADVLEFEIPPSHRKRAGHLVRGSKLAFIRGLRPFHVETLRPQSKFNLELVRAFEDI